MMSHDIYTPYASANIQSLLERLLSDATQPQQYREVMLTLGKHLAEAAAKNIPAHHQIHVVCTVEDADFLAKGIVDTLEARFANVNLSCFWNQRQQIGSIEPVSVAPSFRRYLEPADRIDTLIVVKSIISGSCVVKTNLMDMLDKYTPEQIFILAPVMHKDAERKLKAEFNSDVTDRFTFYSFAIDNTREQDGTVIPGIGGDVYQRLGFKDQNDKNRYTPALIKSRRELLPA